jgi:hypothetical protein
METYHSNARLSIYGIGDTSAFMIKGYTFAFVMGDKIKAVGARRPEMHGECGVGESDGEYAMSCPEDMPAGGRRT